MSRKRLVFTGREDSNSLAAWMHRYLEWMQVQHYSETTLTSRRVDLHQFNEWCSERSLQRPQDITKPILERYQRYLFHYRQANGKPLSFSRQHVRLISLKGFFKWLTKHNHILYNPASELELPRKPHTLPKVILTTDEIETLLNQPDCKTVIGLRDKAILETFYSSGIRRAELAKLTIYAIDRARGTLFINQGKGKKDRVVPVGDRALAWIEKYLQDARPELSIDPHEVTLFLNYKGQPFALESLSALVRDYLEQAKINKPGSCHLLRHAMATAMLENGADIRIIQAILGHARLDTTEQYTHVSISQLKQVHSATHPAKLSRQNTDMIATEAEALLDTLLQTDDSD